ncbi:hypothetical protein LguiA_014924 [Lonicera macranthoides]
MTNAIVLCDSESLTNITDLRLFRTHFCNGRGGPYNYKASLLCGNPPSTTCEDPSQYANWDGLHLTDAANKLSLTTKARKRRSIILPNLPNLDNRPQLQLQSPSPASISISRLNHHLRPSPTITPSSGEAPRRSPAGAAAAGASARPSDANIPNTSCFGPFR